VLAGDDFYRIPVIAGIFSGDYFAYEGAAYGDRFGLLSLSGDGTYLYFEAGFSGGVVNSSLIIPNVNLSALECGRRSKTGFVAGAKPDRLQREMAENPRPC